MNYGSDSAATAEADLRSLAASVLQPVLGDQWIARSGALLPRALEKAGRRRDEEVAARPGAETDIVFYLELSDIITITLNRWKDFKKVLGPSRERWTQESHVLRTLRNTQAHGRRLVEFEEDLLRGIAGDIRNRVTRYRSQMDQQELWYPQIESVTDSLGNSGPLLQHGNRSNIVHTGMVLNVGDVLRFNCIGRDPQGRNVHWFAVKTFPRLAAAEGPEATLEVEIERSMIGANLFLTVHLSSFEDYHKESFGDDHVMFQYTVRPPGAA